MDNEVPKIITARARVTIGNVIIYGHVSQFDDIVFEGNFCYCIAGQEKPFEHIMNKLESGVIPDVIVDDRVLSVGCLTEYGAKIKYDYRYDDYVNTVYLHYRLP